MRYVVQGTIPDELANKFLQHIRDFDSKHPGCHFSIMMQSGREVPIAEMIESLRVEPELTVFQVFERLRERDG